LTKTEKSLFHRASSGVGYSNNKGRSRALHPDLTKMEKALSTGPLLMLDVPMTKNGPGCLILLKGRMLHVVTLFVTACLGILICSCVQPRMRSCH
jgi:hypothetical protein